MLSRLTQKSVPLVSNQVRMMHVPMIRFVGPRHPRKFYLLFFLKSVFKFIIVNKGLGVNDSLDAAHGAHEVAAAVE